MLGKKGQAAPGIPPQYGPQGPPRAYPQPGAFNQPPQQPAVSIEPKTLLLIGAVAVFIILTFTIILVIRASAPRCPETCSAGLCEQNARCSEETDYQCIADRIEGCDVQLEAKKKQCSGKEGALIKTFDPRTEECVTDEDPKVKPVTYTSTVRASAAGSRFRVTTALDNPFNLKNDEVQVEITAEQLGGSNMRVTRVEMEGTDDASKQLVILGESFINKPLPSNQVSATERLRLDVPGSAPSGKISKLKLLIDVAYDQSGSVKTGTVTVSLANLVLTWLRPSATYQCPASCDDADASTRDFCDSTSAPFCKHETVAGACGNGVCESSENKCTCAADCGSCAISGKVTTSQCISNTCQVELKGDVAVEPVKTTTQKSISKASITTALAYNKPFDATKDQVSVTITLDERQADLDALSIDRIQILKGTTEIASKDVSQNLVVIGNSVSASLPLTTTAVEEEMSPQVKIYYTLTSKGVPDKNFYAETMQRIVVYKP